MRGDKVFQYVQPLTEIGLDRQFNRMACRIRHQAAHAGKLFNLLIRTTGAGIGHHINVVVFVKTGQKVVRKLIVRRLPGLNYFFIALFLCDQAAPEVLGNVVNRGLRVRDQLRLAGRNRHIRDRNRHGRPGGIFIANGLNIIQSHRCLGRAVDIDNFFKDLL